ncbi:MAG TPA: hypothetical protein VGB85_05755 [Nannocystis sp.]
MITVSVVLATACSTGEDGGASATESVTAATMPQTTGASTTNTPTTGGVGSGVTTGSSTTGESTGAVSGTTGATGSSDDGGEPRLDLGVDSEGAGCAPEDTCCQAEGFVPPHKLLDTFLAAYPAASMPKTDAELLKFEPVADGHAMAYSMDNVGNEFIDPDKGGVTEANIMTGRMYSRTKAEAEVPVGATVLEVREDPIVIEDLGAGGNGKPGCIGVGWGWGSIIFAAQDKSIGELVYLYVGYCHDGDAEAFYFSEQAVELCPAPG